MHIIVGTFNPEILINGKNEITIVIVGPVGYGKSALINTLFNTNEAVESNSSYSVTKEVGFYRRVLRQELVLTIVDTPGFYGFKTKKPEDIIKEIKEKVKVIDLILFCTKMTERFTNFEDELIRLFKQEYGAEALLEYSIFALTFANEFKIRSENQDKLKHFMNKSNEIRDIIHEIVKESTEESQKVDNIPVIPVGYHGKRSLPGIQDWFLHFWGTCFQKIRSEALTVFIYMGLKQMQRASRMNTLPLLSKDDISKLEHLKFDVYNKNHFIVLERMVEMLLETKE